MRVFPRGGKKLDLERLRLPRRHGGGDIIVEHITAMSPFLMEYEGRPTVLVRLDGLPESEVAALVKAVREDRCLVVAGYRFYSTYPILIISLFIYDSPNRPPLTLEGYRDIIAADVQDFVVGLGRTRGRGRVRLYGSDPVRMLASGEFSLRIPPFRTPTVFSHRTRRRQLKMLWLMFKSVAQQRERIPANRHDFRAAVATHLQNQPNMSNDSTFDRSGVVTR